MAKIKQLQVDIAESCEGCYDDDLDIDVIDDPDDDFVNALYDFIVSKGLGFSDD